MNIKLKGPLPDSLHDIGLRPGQVIKEVKQSESFPAGYMTCNMILEDRPFCFLVKPENYTKL